MKRYYIMLSNEKDERLNKVFVLKATNEVKAIDKAIKLIDEGKNEYSYVYNNLNYQIIGIFTERQLKIEYDRIYSSFRPM